MNFRQLESFLAVVEEGQFVRAARRLFLAPATVTAHIQRLERALGTPLLQRSPVSLTPAGARFVPHARAMVAAARAAADIVKDMHDGRGMPLRVGVVIPGAAELTPAILQAFGKAQPQTRLTLTNLNFVEHISAVLEHRVDVAFVRPPPHDERITADILAIEPRVIVAAAGSELADADGLRLCDVLELNYVGMAAATPHTLTDFVSYASARNGMPARWTTDQAASGPEVINNVAAGFGISTTLYSFARFYRTPDVCFIPVVDAPWEACVLISRRNDRRPEVQAFRSLAVAIARDLGPRLLPVPWPATGT